MKNPTLIEALDRMVYLTGNQGIYYRGTQETAAIVTPCEIQKIF